MNNTKKMPVVLVVDDEPVILETFKAILKELFKVLTASNGKQALEIITQAQVDLVLLDINIPGMNGIEILHKIKEYERNLPVILVTATANADMIVEAKRLGIDDYLTKPFDVDKVIALVHKTIKKERNIYMESPRF